MLCTTPGTCQNKGSASKVPQVSAPAGLPPYGCITSSSFLMAGEGEVPGAPRRGTLTSGQAWEGTEAIQVLGHLFPQVFEGTETREQGGD